jgi:DNA-directed RNA polymerase subunit RPC12/RpoP
MIYVKCPYCGIPFDIDKITKTPISMDSQEIECPNCNKIINKILKKNSITPEDIDPNSCASQ